MLGRYGCLGSLKLFLSLIYTRIFFSGVRLIRLPFDIRNSKNIDLGNGLTTGVGCRLEAYTKDSNKVLFIGNNVQINDYVHITASENVTIGDNVLIASKVYISDCSHGSYGGDHNDSSPLITPEKRAIVSRPVMIGANVWLGESVSVLPGVTIGSGTIVGSNSVVTKSLPENVIAVGSPAKPIKKFNFEAQRWEII